MILIKYFNSETDFRQNVIIISILWLSRKIEVEKSELIIFPWIKIFFLLKSPARSIDGEQTKQRI